MLEEEYRAIFSKNLRRFMNLNNKNQKDLMDDLGLGSSTVSSWCTGLKLPRMNKIQMLADYFGIEKSDLLEDRQNVAMQTKKKGVRIPVFETLPIDIATGKLSDTVDWEEITEEMASTGSFIALKIKGYRMEPRICDNDIVIVRLQSCAESGSIVIVRIGSVDETLCHRLIKNQDGITLMPFNPAFEPIYYSNEDIKELPVVIIGKVVELRAKF